MEKIRCYGCMRLKEEAGICPYCGYDDSNQNAIHQLPAGTVLKEQYLIGKVLGQGGFGITYMGWDLYLDIPVAIKEYYPNGAVMRDCKESTEVISYSGEVGVRFRNNKERFMREVKMLARFSDVREIVQVKTFFLANNTAYIVMEYLQGITLKDYVKKMGGRLEPELTLRLLYPVMEALGKVHRAKLVHRDISPDNIMILEDGTVKLLDFGAVRDVGMASPDKALTKSTEAILKQGYAPLEQYQAKGSLGPWTDVYAFCGTVYYCLTGEIPPDAPERVLGEEMQGFAAKGVDLLPEVEEIFMHGMALRADERIQDMGVLYEQLAQAMPSVRQSIRVVWDDSTDSTDSENADSNRIGSGSTAQNRTGAGVTGQKNTAQGTAENNVIEQRITGNNGNGTVAKDDTDQKKGTGNKGIKLMNVILLALVLIPLVSGVIWGISKKMDNGSHIGEISGNCGDQMGVEITYHLDLWEGVLTIEGNGAIDDYIDYIEEMEAAEGAEILAAPWAEYRDSIKEIVMQGEIVRIGANAFAGCKNLEKVTLPESIRTIGLKAFAYCDSLKEITIPYQVTYLHDGVFEQTPLQKLHIEGQTEFTYDPENGSMGIFSGNPEGNFRIEALTGTFAETACYEMGIPFVSLGYVEGYAVSGQCGHDVFWSFKPLEGVLELYGTGATYDYNGAVWHESEGQENTVNGWPEWNEFRQQIKKVIIGEGITRIGYDAFAECSALEIVEWGSVEQLCGSSFCNTGLTDVVLPESVWFIDGYVFGFCQNLTSVSLPSSVREMGEAFMGCENLQRLEMRSQINIWSYMENGSIFINENGSGNTDQLIIYGTANSSARAFAQSQNLPFVLLDE